MADLRKRFRQIVALMRSTTFPAERNNAEQMARQIAAKLGITFEQALRDLDGSSRNTTKDSPQAWHRKAEENVRKAQDDLRRAQSEYRRHQREREKQEEADRRAREERAEQRRQDDERRRRQEEERRCKEDAERHEREALAQRQRLEQEQRRRHEDARRRREAAERRARLPSVIARYGRTKADVLRPTPREVMILNAVAKWRRLTPDKRWTESLDGWSDGISRAPAHVEAAVREAYPMPTTYQQALAEWMYWIQRYEDLCIALNIDLKGYDGDALDLPVMLRERLVHDLVLHAMPLTEVRDVVDRMRRCREENFFSEEVIDALLRDLDYIAERSPPQAEVPSEPSSPLNLRVIVSLKRDPSRSNREIAREVGCSPTVVGHVRKKAGLDAEMRIVRRKGQTYHMRRRARQPAKD